MLTHLSIKNFLIAEEVELDFTSGMTAILGETGSGKSVLMESLAIVCGIKNISSKLLREDAPLKIEASFDLNPVDIEKNPFLKQFLDGETTLILSLESKANGRIVRRANGEMMVLQSIKKLTSNLVDIHSQYDNFLLFSSEGQLNLLDSFGGAKLRKVQGDYSACFKKFQEDLQAIENLKKSVNNLDVDYLKFKIDEIKKFNIQPLEIEKDNQRLTELSGMAKMKSALENLQSPTAMLNQLYPDLKSNLNDLLETPLKDSASQALSALEELETTFSEIQNSRFDEDPYEIDRLNERLFQLSTLQSKYGMKTSDILSALEKMESQLDSLASFESDLKGLEKKKEEDYQALLSIAEKLTAQRKETSKSIEKEISKNMSELGLLSGGFKVDFMAKEEPDQTGKDEIRFMVSLNKGMVFVPLKEGVSGGENSRIMLSIKAVLNKVSPIETLVFDEIDSGISGRIAFQAGAKMAKMSRESQLFCITHLPQVASFADQCVLVEKKVGEQRTTAAARVLEGDHLEEAIAYLIAGNSKTQTSIDAAKELVSEARKVKEKA